MPHNPLLIIECSLEVLIRLEPIIVFLLRFGGIPFVPILLDNKRFISGKVEIVGSEPLKTFHMLTLVWNSSLRGSPLRIAFDGKNKVLRLPEVETTKPKFFLFSSDV